MKNGRSRRTLLLAFLLATAAAVVAFTFVSNRDKSGAASPPIAPTPPPLVAVLVATTDIPSGTTLTPGLIELRRVPPDQRAAGALAEPGEATGKVTTVALLSGQQLLDTTVADTPAPETFAFSVPVGKRAVSIKFDEVLGTGGLIQPGDHVDVIGFFELELYAPIPGGGGGGEFSFVVSEDGAELLADPDPNAVVVATLDEGTELTVLTAQGRYFRVETADGQIGWIDATAVTTKPEDDGGSGSSGDEIEIGKFPTKMASYILQDVEVLAVAQALTPDELGMEDENGQRKTSAKDEATTDEAAQDEGEPVARPQAKSATLAITPEQAQRLVLAQAGGAVLRLALRAPGDTTTVSLPPAEVGLVPVGNAMDSVTQPVLPTELVITDVEFTQRVVTVGQVLEFKATVKNVSERTIPAAKTAPPEFMYTEGFAYDALGFTADPGSYRIGLNVGGAFPTQFPYRWSLGRDLAPGESLTIVGSVQLTDPAPNARYWLGVIFEPNFVVQDGVAVTDVSVLLPDGATVDAQPAELRVDPDDAAEVVAILPPGRELKVIGARAGWVQVKAGDAEGWVRLSAVRVAGASPTEPIDDTGGAPIKGGFDVSQFNPWGGKEGAQ